MSYKLKRSEAIQAGVRRIATQQIDLAISEIDDASVDLHATVHQVRKRCKKLRGLIRLIRPALGGEYNVANAAFRDTASPLSGLRDARSMIVAFDDLTEQFGSQVQPDVLGTIRDALSRRLIEVTDDEIKLTFAFVRQQLVDSRKRANDWRLSATGFMAIGDGVAKTHHRAAACLKAALDDPSTEVLHQLRKRVKYHWYHVRLLRSVWPAMMNPYAAELNELGESLGKDHDLAVLGETITTFHEDIGSRADIKAFIDLMQQRRERDSATAIAAARRAFAQPTDAWVKRIKALWKLWR